MIKPIIIVVEGVNDKQLLESFLPYEIVTTNGSSVPRGTIEYLIKASDDHRIIILVDPDGPGERIRAILNQAIPSAVNVFIPKEQAIRKHKVGVFETKKEHILAALKNEIPNSYAQSETTITMTELYQLRLLGAPEAKSRRAKVANHLHIGTSNGKTLLRRLNSLKITSNDIRGILNEA